MLEEFKNFEIIENADLKKFCTFHIGGKGTIIFPKNVKELEKIIKICENNGKKWFILGNGSNLLFSDFEITTILVSLKYFNKLKKENQIVYVGAGVNLFKLHSFLKGNSLGGLEWAYGIPASVGGAIFMNAGAFGHEFMENILEIEVFQCGRVEKIKKENLKYSYRKLEIDGVILGAKMKFNIENKDEISKLQTEYMKRRQDSQPYKEYSAGSVFKRNENIIPAKIIDTFGLKGVKIGGAEISKKHAGFIINTGDAKAIDVLALIEYIKRKTKQNFELEIIFVK